ncbi:hypothetical protein [Streptomyces sp. NBC_01525]|uniref:hypothetical protein n=1 Tax=Streptomyces sp. NBC_01525 TaxID=2903893 RepID=UPI003870CCCD
MGERALRNPALGAEPGATPGSPAGDQRLPAEILDEAAVRVVVVAPVGRQRGRAASLIR